MVLYAILERLARVVVRARRIRARLHLTPATCLSLRLRLLARQPFPRRILLELLDVFSQMWLLQLLTIRQC